MTSYYTDILYPLQDKVLKVLGDVKSEFYLTGGTALSRAYLGHRYSDDLDFFVNQNDNFVKLSEEVLRNLSSFRVTIDIKSETYFSFMVEDKLKIDLVNDSGKHFGEIKKTPLFWQTDNIENILANKLTAIIGRDEPKDVVDIWAISKYQKVNWKEVFTASNSKAVGIFPPNVAERLDEFPVSLLEEIKWVEGQRPENDKFESDIDKIIEEMLEG